ncbi:MAG: proteasome subunit beta [Deltaproteobacteria bacterium]|nr:proteasome subunit beta [Deltaproteobacteria bacterium]
MRLRSEYEGSSFFDLLKHEHPQLLPEISTWNQADGGRTSIPHGTTVLSLKCVDGVLVAGDRLATAGHSVASRDVVKVFATDNHSCMAISGAAGPSIEMARMLSVELEHYEKIEGQALELEGKANKLSQMVRQNLPAAMQGLAVVPLFAGFDQRRKVGRLWKFDITGGRYEEAEFDATGSGGLYARETLKQFWHPGLSRSEALALAVRALTAAADEDRATGGVDLERGIYPVIKICTLNGIEEGAESEIEEVYRSVISERRSGEPRA